MSQFAQNRLSAQPGVENLPNGDQSAGQANFPAQFCMLDEVREFVGRHALDCGLDDKAVYAVQLAVDEAFTNIIEHAFGGECEESIECTCHCTSDALEITLIDCGKPFNPDAVPEPDLISDLEDRQVGGLGLYFMRKMMDEVQFTFANEASAHPGCNLLRLVKRKKKPPKRKEKKG